ncbi:hypothetical protein DUNSADRAFT_14039 [Dunaliella salina]|uniref:Uncharacterized protein n=1 Tax=Dunaliella salina TaxID=3046 RepID=A0ABQ7G847_DUNSA|nr:hypothetical protein DUNSADRAFT_14039 [Dunaliella salina]|eukprot:KAF5830790.1 hypothetical protein DUNSADRAFT_14039 [Dunaliella salina]
MGGGGFHPRELDGHIPARNAVLHRLVLVVHDEKDATVYKAWMALMRSRKAKSRLAASVTTLVICDPFSSGQRKRTDFDIDCFYWSLQREQDALAFTSLLLDALPHLSQFQLVQGKFHNSLLRPLGVDPDVQKPDLKLGWNKTSGSCLLQTGHASRPPLMLTWWCSRISKSFYGIRV